MIVKKIKKLGNKEKRLTFYKDTSLMFVFFLPFGFDIVQYYLITITGDVWRANIIMYFISGLFFTSYFSLRRRLNK